MTEFICEMIEIDTGRITSPPPTLAITYTESSPTVKCTKVEAKKARDMGW